MVVLVAWDRPQRHWVASRYSAMVLDFAHDAFMFDDMFSTGLGRGATDVLDLILLRALLIAAYIPLGLMMFLIQAILIARSFIGETIRSGFDVSHQFVYCLGVLLFPITSPVGMAIVFAILVVGGVVIQIALSYMRLYEIFRAVAIGSTTGFVLKSRQCGLHLYATTVLCCTVRILSISTYTIRALDGLSTLFRRTAALCAAVVAVVVSCAIVKLTLSRDGTQMTGGNGWYAGWLWLFSKSGGISQRSGLFYLGIDDEMQAHTYFGPVQVSDVSNTGTEEQEATSSIGLKQPTYVVKLRTGVVGWQWDRLSCFERGIENNLQRREV